ncbi:hypothetical protein TanjilG_00971 [Lupinus angustifolius]|uniref:VQ domain-containing protein n=1 Tax=Lupinus angustifolius TaxID=3871 RepID=A0A4P1QQZ4_LUPAN|nr:hypothetical protein TanjilG_00971 [Lupinus angustifolius]
MEDHSCSYASSTTSYLSQNPNDGKGLKNGDSFQSQTVQKSQAKAWKKGPVASQTKVYKVDPMNFRDLVQQLTGAPQFKSQTHHPYLNFNH